MRAILSFIILLALVGEGPGAEVPRIIFDSDMSSDWDDVGDIAVLHGLANTGECTIIGMLASSGNGGTPLCMDAINTWYGRPDIPIGVRPDVEGVGGYPGRIASEYPHGPEQSPKDFPLAADLCRRLLAASPDKSVVIVSTGYLNNLQALLQSGPDQHSPLSGAELIRKKVRLWSCAAGAFPKGAEFNLRVEAGAAHTVVNQWPGAVMYTGFEIGSQIRTAGRLPETPTDNPIRSVYTGNRDHGYPYPSWGQIALYYAVRASEGLWDEETRGRNTADAEGGNSWVTDRDPVGDQDQGYLLEKVRHPVNHALDALMVSPPIAGPAVRPPWPSNLRAAVHDGQRVELRWTDNAANEDGFIIERAVGGVYVPLATVGANVPRHPVTGLASTANASFRVKAFNAAGDSDFSHVWIYSGWSEIDASGAALARPLYAYYQSSNLRWLRGGDERVEHVAVNHDSDHGQEVAIDVDVGAGGCVYFLYQDADNWYRLNAEGPCRFEKRIKGVISQVGPAGPVVKIAAGSGLEHWRIEVAASGTLAFIRHLPYATGKERDAEATGRLLQVSEALSLTRGRIGLGGRVTGPIWQNFHFTTATSTAGRAPAAPLAVTATGRDAQVVLRWQASPGATCYDVYRSIDPEGADAAPIATGITATNLVDPFLSNGATYRYTVRAVNPAGVSGNSTAVSAKPVPPSGNGGFLNGGFEIPGVGGYVLDPRAPLVGWTFTGNAGIQRNGSAYGGPAAPEGRQTAFVQGVQAALGAMAQDVALAKGTYAITFQAARRGGVAQPISVQVNGISVGTHTPAVSGFAPITTDPFAITAAGTYRVTFAATDAGGDKTSFIDGVAITTGGVMAAAVQVPVAATP